jgi:hypothetical protein
VLTWLKRILYISRGRQSGYPAIYVRILKVPWSFLHEELAKCAGRKLEEFLAPLAAWLSLKFNSMPLCRRFVTFVTKCDWYQIVTNFLDIPEMMLYLNDIICHTWCDTSKNMLFLLLFQLLYWMINVGIFSITSHSVTVAN